MASCLPFSLPRCDVVVDPQPNQGWIGSWFRSKKAAGYKPDLVRAPFLNPKGGRQGRGGEGGRL